MESWNEESETYIKDLNYETENQNNNADKFDKTESGLNIKGEFVCEIYNYQIKFPFEPYKIQKEYMARVLRAWWKSENALLESPTGTGKTLSLLCSSLAWLESELIKTHGSSGVMECSKILNLDYKTRPKIIYASRTHSQLAQVIDELKSTPYKPKTSVIASRDHLWIHKELSKLNGSALNIAWNKSIRDINNDDRCRFKERVDTQIESDLKLKWWGIEDIEEIHK